VLPNGLTVLTRENPGSGVVAVNTWVKAGYFNEPDEVAGMAHLFEHMFFKGSKAYPGADAIAQAISGAGGVANAGTIYDSTNYYVIVPKESFRTAAAIQADAIAHPLFDPAELKKEAEVVIEESNRKLDNPGPVSFERMIAASFTRHRVKRWRIGSNEVLRNIRRENLVAFFETLYRPENIIVTVAGDVTHEEALAVVREKFGTIPRGQLRKERGPTEPPQAEFRFAHAEADIKEGYAVLGWHTVPENHADEQLLEMLASILGGGRSSRFYKGVVGPQGASTVSASHFTFDDVGLFSVAATMPEANRAEVERKLMAEIERMKRYGPTAYELAQAKNVYEAAFLRNIDTAIDQTQALARAEARGSYRDLLKERDQVAAATAAQVREVARKYLTLERATLYQYQPKGSAALTREAALARLRDGTQMALAEPESPPLPSTANTVRPSRADAPPESFTLANGMRLVVQQRASTPLVSTAVIFHGGRTQESVGNQGITRLMLGAMRRGTDTRTGETIDRELAFLGAQLGTVNADDGFGFTFDTPTATYEPTLDIVADILQRPTFADENVVREKAVQAAAARRVFDSATERPLQLYRAALYGDHPYGLLELGTDASLAALDPAALRTWWRQSLAADRGLVLVVGNVAAEDVKRVVEAKLGAMPRASAALRPLPPVPKLTATKELIEQRERKQTPLVVAFPAVTAASPDWAALRLLRTLTSGLSGTFYQELRGRQSLAYVVYARPVSFAQDGTFIGYIACEAGKEEAARRGLLGEMRKLAGPGIRDEDVERSKKNLIGSTRIARESSSSLAGEYAINYLLGVPLDSVDRMLAQVPGLTPDDLRAVSRKYLQGDAYVYAAVRGRP